MLLSRYFHIDPDIIIGWSPLAHIANSCLIRVNLHDWDSTGATIESVTGALVYISFIRRSTDLDYFQIIEPNTPCRI